MKKNQKPILIIAIVLCVTFIGCGSGFDNLSEMNRWLNDPDNGCLQSKEIGNFKFTLKYLPSSYLAIRNLHGKAIHAKEKEQLFDSLLSKQEKVLTFILSISPEGNERGKDKEQVNVMQDGLTSRADYNQRVHSMNFSIEKYLELYADSLRMIPIAAFVENVYELSDSRNFMIAFPNEKTLMKTKEYTIVFEDPYYNAGKMQFHFSGDEMKKAERKKIKLNNY